VAALYSTLFAAAVITTTGPHVLFTVPAGYVAVLRDVGFLNTSGVTGPIYLYDSSVSTAWWASPSVANFGSVEWQGRQVFPAGSEISVQLGNAPWVVRASGYLLSV
jgi:hypothetical protein